MGIQNLESESASERSSLNNSTTSASFQVIEINNSLQFRRVLCGAGRKIAVITVKRIQVGGVGAASTPKFIERAVWSFHILPDSDHRFLLKNLETNDSCEDFPKGR